MSVPRWFADEVRACLLPQWIKFAPARRSCPSRDGSPDEVRTCLLPQWIKFAPARRERTRGGGTNGSPSSCESPSPPSGRAARAEVSDAFRLPPGGCCDRHGIGCRPRGRSRAGTGRIVRSIKKALWNLHSVFLLFVRKHLNIKCFTDLEKQIKGGGSPATLDLIQIRLCYSKFLSQFRLTYPL